MIICYRVDETKMVVCWLLSYNRNR